MLEFFRGSFSEAIFIKDLLEKNNILVFIGNEYVSSTDPFSISYISFTPAILKTQEFDYRNVTKIIDDYAIENSN